MRAPAASELRALLDGVRRLGFAGVNVTFPYKEAVVDLLDELSPGAATMGAVNTVVVRDQPAGRSQYGHHGFCAGCERSGRRCGAWRPLRLIGAGGVGKAIAFALANLGVAEIRIFDTDRTKADRLALLLRPCAKAVAVNDVEDAVRGAVGVANATPVGMFPGQGKPVPDALLHDGLWVADAVYFPLLTPLLRAAGGRGARIMSERGLAILPGGGLVRIVQREFAAYGRDGKCI